MPEIGDKVDDFTATAVSEGEITELTLSDYADGRATALVFYIHDFSPVCETQMCEINDSEFLTFNDDVVVLGVSTDGPYSHRRFIEDNDLSYPLVYDEDKRIYEMFDMIVEGEEGRQKPKRGIVLVDGEFTIRYWWQAQDNWDSWGMKPVSDVSEVLDELKST